jgi:UDP-N-acetylglucosamine 2-epimerase (non-hydrolysing)
MRITAVVGARPNFVKIAAIMAEARKYPDLDCRLIHTGQHYDARMSDSFFQELDIPAPDVNLGVGPGSSAAQTGEIMVRLADVLDEHRPDVVLVVGDVNSTVAAALVAVKMGLPVAHVEAGLRSFDRAMPEEINRVVTDAISDYCFTTEPAAGENLLHEGVPASRIFYVGNVMIDTLLRFRDQAGASTVLERLGLARGQFAVLTLHRPSNVDDASALRRLLDGLLPVQRDLPVIFPVHPRTRQRLAELPATVVQGLRLVEPLGYLDFVHLMASATCVLTDSGGIQEETTALGVPCLTLRTTTERPITVTVGTNRVVGLDPAETRRAWETIRAGAWPKGRVPELWDGKAAERIVKVLLGAEPR